MWAKHHHIAHPIATLLLALVVGPPVGGEVATVALLIVGIDKAERPTLSQLVLALPRTIIEGAAAGYWAGLLPALATSLICLVPWGGTSVTLRRAIGISLSVATALALVFALGRVSGAEYIALLLGISSVSATIAAWFAARGFGFIVPESAS